MKTNFNEAEIFSLYRSNTKKPEFTLIILHRLGSDGAATQKFAELLLKKIPNIATISYDLRGHGLSTKSWSQGSRQMEDDLVKDLHSIAQKCSKTKLVFVGESLGGVVVQEYFLRKLSPNPVHSFLICTHPAFFSLLKGRALRFALLKRMASLGGKTKKRSYEQHQNNKGRHELDPKRVFVDIWHTGFFRWLLLFSSLFGWQNKNWELFDKSSLTYVYASRDFFIHRKRQERALKHFANIKKKLVDSNHFCILNNPEELSEIIADTIKSL